LLRDEAEAQIVVPVIRRIVVAIGAPHVPGLVVPATAPDYAVGAFTRLPLKDFPFKPLSIKKRNITINTCKALF
jgi:hypothetical protein